MHVEIEGLAFSYKKTDTVLKDVSFTLSPGEIVAILGQSGSGKSTLLRILSGLEMPEKGTIRVDGVPWVNAFNALPPQKRKVGMVFQSYALFPHLNVEANIAFGLKGSSKKHKDARIKAMLELVGLSTKRKSYPHELSGGQRQRVALARALAPEPEVLLLDEPFSNLDETLKDRVRGELAEILRASRTTTILVTHDRRDASAIAHAIYSIDEGTLHPHM